MKEELVEKVFYKKGQILTLKEATEQALLFFSYIKLTEADLFDYWYGLADNWDLNIWIWDDDEMLDIADDEEIVNVSLFPVNTGTNETIYKSGTSYRVIRHGHNVTKDGCAIRDFE